MGDYVPNIVNTLREDREQAVKIAKIEVAKKLLVKGMDLQEILEITGLSKEDIEGLE